MNHKVYAKASLPNPRLLYNHAFDMIHLSTVEKRELSNKKEKLRIFGTCKLQVLSQEVYRQFLIYVQSL